MKKVALIVHPAKAAASQAAAELARVGGSSGLEVLKDLDDTEVDALIALGGDGTILRAAAHAHARRVPLLGINLGNLGYLSTTDAGQLDSVVRSLLDEDFRTEERMMLECEAFQEEASVAKVVCLNEIVAERGTLSRVVRIRVRVDDEEVATYTSDGFIVSTPTGSTAYSLSAGGPVVEPGVAGMILTSVSAHSPLWRSIVVAPTRTVVLETPWDGVALSADGQHVAFLEPGARVVVLPSPVPLTLIKLNGIGFFEKLRTRFRLELEAE